MRWKSVRKNSELGEIASVFEIEWQDEVPKSVTFQDPGSGQTVRVIAGQYSGISILVPEPPKTKEVWVVSAWLDEATKYYMEYDNQFDAQKRVDDLRANYSSLEKSGLKPLAGTAILDDDGKTISIQYHTDSPTAG